MEIIKNKQKGKVRVRKDRQRATNSRYQEFLKPLTQEKKILSGDYRECFYIMWELKHGPKLLDSALQRGEA
eukprot:UN25430